MLDAVERQAGPQTPADEINRHATLDLRAPTELRRQGFQAPAGAAVLVTVVASLGFWIALIGWWILP